MIPPTRRRNLMLVAAVALIAAGGALLAHRYKKQQDHDAVVAACEANSATACSQLCNEPNHPSATACLKLGIMYADGTQGVEQDAAKAVPFFSRACEGQELEGCARFGRALLNGAGIERDEPKAVTVLQRACEGHNQLGCVGLGFAK
ncbi:MAG TPA: hypothetical protein PKW66_15295, partial [Polyangiaceae bacterium]|nr:hypothetical protein [Polyangiaceae bacterium]